MDTAPIWLTLKLATVATVILLCLGLPLAWWLSRGAGAWRAIVWSLTALPLVLPPTVLGFYLLIVFSPNSTLGSVLREFFGFQVAFSFSGLVLASCLYSLPFVVQPMQVAFAQIDKKMIEAAYSLGASATETFWRVVLPQLRPALVVATVLGFAHTVGEFGVVLMIGGNIPDETRVVSIALYEQVETLNYGDAHLLSAGLMLFSFVVLLVAYHYNHSVFSRSTKSS